MANELSLSQSLVFNKGNASANRNSGSSSVTVTGTKYTSAVQSIGLVDETLALGDVGTIGYVLLHNMDATNFVTFGPDGSVYALKLKAGEWALVRWNGAAIHAKADTGACAVEYVIVED